MPKFTFGERGHPRTRGCWGSSQLPEGKSNPVRQHQGPLSLLGWGHCWHGMGVATAVSCGALPSPGMETPHLLETHPRAAASPGP